MWEPEFKPQNQKERRRSQISHALAYLWNLKLKPWSSYSGFSSDRINLSPFKTMIMTMIIMGHECERGTIWGGKSMGGEGAKEGILKGKKDQSMLHVYVWRQHNETNQWENGNIIEGVNLFKVHCTHIWNYHNETPTFY
jgi:hypothetical protein